jgi:Delta7-sterol 5-desaturase
MLTHLHNLFLNWAALYTLLLGIYLLLGKSVSVWNQKLGPTQKIQTRISPDSEIKRDFWQSIKSLMFIALFLSGGLYSQQIGLTLLSPFPLTPFQAILWFLISLILFDTWFYWGHRLIHTKALYRWVHAWHHQSISPTVWSNNSDTLLDNCVLQSYFLIAPLCLPMPGVVLIAHKIYDQITGMMGHAGYEYSAGPLSRFPSPMIGVTFHDQHHERFRYNYATHFSIWDRLMQTIHPDYDKTIQTFENKPESPTTTALKDLL